MNDMHINFNGSFPALEFTEQGFAGSSRPISRKVRLGRRIGEGSTGIVVEGILETDGASRPVAVKIMRPELAGTPSARRFEREATLLCTFSHPCLVRGIGCGSVRMGEGGAPPLPFLVMERVDGPTLAQELKTGHHADDPLWAIDIAIGVASALGYIHLDGRVQAHRDIKPANILLAGGTAPKLIDLGVAKAILPQRPESPIRRGTLSTQLAGTLAYMAPEQVADSSRVDIRSDIYSLGLVLGELLGCRMGGSEPGAQSFGAIPQLDRLDARRLRIDGRTRTLINALLATACAWEPERRFQSPSDLCRSLDKIRTELLKSSEEFQSRDAGHPKQHHLPIGKLGANGAMTRGRRQQKGGSFVRTRRMRIAVALLALAATLALAIPLLSSPSNPFSSHNLENRPQPPAGREIIVDPENGTF